VEISTKITGNTLILPNNLDFIKDALLKESNGEVISTIKLYRFIKQQIESEEFIEDEQLYKASESHKEELTYEIEVIKVKDINVLVVPIFQDVINYEIITKELLTYCELDILTITPGTLPFDSLIAEIGNTSTSYPQLIPPFVITGISASLVSQASIQFKQIKALVLQSEGVSGYEKINHDSIREISHYLQSTYNLSSKFIKNVETLVTARSSVNNFGLYI